MVLANPFREGTHITPAKLLLGKQKDSWTYPLSWCQLVTIGNSYIVVRPIVCCAHFILRTAKNFFTVSFLQGTRWRKTHGKFIVCRALFFAHDKEWVCHGLFCDTQHGKIFFSWVLIHSECCQKNSLSCASFWHMENS
jgi:hypothetical protein